MTRQVASLMLIALLAAAVIAGLAVLAGQTFGQTYGVLTVALLSTIWVPYFVRRSLASRLK